jgi:rRNA-processing protein FCF1
MRVAMDTSALMMPVECNVRVFEELDRLLGGFEPVVPRAVVDELEKLSDGGGEEGTAASVGRDLAERCAVLDHEESYADDALVEVAREGRCEYVVTNDGPLKERLLGEGVPVIGLRGQNKLAVTQP